MALCNRFRTRRGQRRAAYPRRAWLAAYGLELARVAERIEFELPADLRSLLSPAWLPTPANGGSRRQLAGESHGRSALQA